MLEYLFWDPHYPFDYFEGDDGEAVMRCPSCGKDIPDHVDDITFTCCDSVPDICPHCGCDLWKS